MKLKIEKWEILLIIIFLDKKILSKKRKILQLINKFFPIEG